MPSSVIFIFMSPPKLSQSLVTRTRIDLKPKYEKYSVSFTAALMVNSPFSLVVVPFTWFRFTMFTFSNNLSSASFINVHLMELFSWEKVFAAIRKRAINRIYFFIQGFNIRKISLGTNVPFFFNFRFQDFFYADDQFVF